jgi:hypothetical protein
LFIHSEPPRQVFATVLVPIHRYRRQVGTAVRGMRPIGYGSSTTGLAGFYAAIRSFRHSLFSF